MEIKISMNVNEYEGISESINNDRIRRLARKSKRMAEDSILRTRDLSG